MPRKKSKPALLSSTFPSALNVGATKEAIEAARDAVLRFFDSKRGDECVSEALRCFAKICEVGHTTVSDCTFTYGTTTGA